MSWGWEDYGIVDEGEACCDDWGVSDEEKVQTGGSRGVDADMLIACWI